jgi:hypothetical protein
VLEFVNYMAGKPYVVAKRWAVEKGLGFGQLPLFEDRRRHGGMEQVDRFRCPAAAGLVGPAGHLDRMDIRLGCHFRPLLAQAMVGEATVDEVMKSARSAGTASATRWPRTDPRRRSRTRPPFRPCFSQPMWTTNRFPFLWVLPALLPVAVSRSFRSATRCGPACTR